MQHNAKPILMGLEEEVFVTEPVLPSLSSLYYLARLLWRNPAYYYTHSASNFARGRDLRQAVMSGIEVSTGVHSSVDSLMEDLSARRRELASVTDGLILPIGHLFDLEAPTNTCGLHIHIGPVPERETERIYSNLAHFLPLLALLTVSSPLARGRYFGQSFRIAKSYAIGPLRKEDKRYRFQDMIISRRLGTIELRIFDPVWDLERIRVLIKCIEAILRTDRRFDWNEDSYRHCRRVAAEAGYNGNGPGHERDAAHASDRDPGQQHDPGRAPDQDMIMLSSLYSELSEFCDVDERLFRHTASDELYEFWKAHGTLKTYIAIDNAYRNGVFGLDKAALPEAERRLARLEPGQRVLRAASGLLFYYAVKLPYIILKGLKEQS
ncbi:MAG TPA: hypothetical protein GX506_06220 [Firmicutes bacterium]|nr:hypothetical protein [Bacillota bacterium]